MSIAEQIADVLSGRSRWCVVTGDCLDVLRAIPAGSVDAVVTDPPYGINTKSDRDGKLNPWADLCNAALWYREWLGQSRRILAPSGVLWSCLNWRSLTTFQKASCDLGWPIESLAIWDKQWIGPGGYRGLRPSYECVALWCCENAGLADRGTPDVIRAKWSSHKPNGHPAEKPTELTDWCLALARAGTTRPQVVVDPFCGSGTTGVSAMRADDRFIGIELDDKWADIARRRIGEAAKHLFANTLGQHDETPRENS